MTQNGRRSILDGLNSSQEPANANSRLEPLMSVRGWDMDSVRAFKFGIIFDATVMEC